MKKITKNQLSNIRGGISGRSCMLLGGGALLFAMVGRWESAFATVVGAAGSGCFDN